MKADSPHISIYYCYYYINFICIKTLLLVVCQLVLMCLESLVVLVGLFCRSLTRISMTECCFVQSLAIVVLSHFHFSIILGKIDNIVGKLIRIFSFTVYLFNLENFTYLYLI